MISNQYLEKIEILNREKVFQLNEDNLFHIGRGFADLGYEEFYVLDQFKLYSLYTKKITEFMLSDIDNFFYIPNLNILLAKFKELTDLKFNLFFDSLWVLEFNNLKRENINIQYLLIDSIVELLEIDINFNKPRSLKVEK